MHFKTIFKSLKNKDMLKRILIIFGILVAYRIIAHIPVPLGEPATFKEAIGNLISKSDFGSFIDLISGGGLTSFSIILVGISPYITASIVIQLLTKAIPSLEEISQDGETGRRKINQWTRIASIPLAIIQSIAYIFILYQSVLGANASVVADPTPIQWVISISAMVAGSTILMWLGELITEQGIGNGISMIIFASIVSRLPNTLGTLWNNRLDTSNGSLSVFGWFDLPVNPTYFWVTIGFVFALIAVIYFLVKLNEAQRIVTINYAKRVHGNSAYGGIRSILPMKLIAAGVIPVIFAQSLLQTPIMLVQLFDKNGVQGFWGKVLNAMNQSNWFNPGNWVNTIGAVVYVLLIIGFAYFYTEITFNPLEIAENLKRSGGFIPGIRPGKPTSDYLTSILKHIIFIGAIGLSIVAILPLIFNGLLGASVSFGGTSIIIIVGVILETLVTIKAMMAERSYKDIKGIF